MEPRSGGTQRLFEVRRLELVIAATSALIPLDGPHRRAVGLEELFLGFRVSAMDASLVMTIIGPDRPGLVELIANVVAQHGGNWLESHMSRLGGQFAGILRLQLPAEQERAFTNALEDLEGLSITVHSDRPSRVDITEPLWSLEIVGQDRPGIVREISHALARREVNVEELQTECHSAAMSGETMFTARAKVRIPRACSVTELHHDLEKIGQDLIVDVLLQE